MRYLITQSLLSSWSYAMKENPYEDMTSEGDKYAEFMQVLRREPTPTNEAMQNGIDFENLVTKVLRGDADSGHKWYEAAADVAKRIKGAYLQVPAQIPVTVADIDFLIYGRLDALRAGTIFDTKFSTKYEAGKYFDSMQHPTYFEIVPGADTFVYIISNGTNVWTEPYYRETTRSILDEIESFVGWLNLCGHADLYKEKWVTK